MGGEFKKRGFRPTKYSFLNFIDRLSFGRIFLMWVLMIIVFGLIFFALSLDSENALLYRGNAIAKNINGLFDSVYYSFITATTTGYGDISPQGLSKLFAVIEVLFGVIVSGILISKLIGVKQEVILEEVYNISYEEVVDRLKNGLYLFRSDINRTLEKIEIGTVKQREIKDLWILFSGLDNSLTNIKNFIIPPKTDSLYSKKLDTLKLELLLNSIKLSMRKINDFIKALKNHDLEWRNELLLTSIYYDVQVVNEIIEYETKKTSDKKVIDRLNELRIIIADIESELKPGKKEELAKLEKEAEDAAGKEQPPKEELNEPDEPEMIITPQHDEPTSDELPGFAGHETQTGGNDEQEKP